MLLYLWLENCPYVNNEKMEIMLKLWHLLTESIYFLKIQFKITPAHNKISE